MGGPDPLPWEGAILRGKGRPQLYGHSVVVCAKRLNRSRCRLVFGLGWAQKHVLGWMLSSAVWGGDAASCQITLTAC